MRYFVFTFFVCLTLWKASGQQFWDLQRCIDFSLENNLEFNQTALNTDIQKIKLSQTRFSQLPYISGEVTGYENYGRSIDPNTNTYANVNSFSNAYSIDASVNIFGGFVKRNQIAFQKYVYKAQQSRQEQQRNILIYSVIGAYYSYILTREMYNLSVDNLLLMQKQRYSTQRLIDVGRKAESDIYELDSKLASDSFLLIQKLGNMELALLKLKGEMNYPVADSLLVDTTQFYFSGIKDSINLKELTENVKRNFPDIKVTENEMIAAKKYINQVRGKFSPSLDFVAGWSSGYYINSGSDPEAFKFQFKNNGGEYAGFTLSIPIFSRFSNVSNLKLAHLNFKLAQNEHLQKILDVERDVNTVYLNWQISGKEYLSAQSQLEKCRISYLVAEKKLQLGQINVIEYYIQKNEMQNARADVLRTLLQLALYDKYIGFLLNGNWN
jgi:outer membrane protein